MAEDEFSCEAVLLLVAVDLLGKLDDRVLQLAHGGPQVVDVRASVLGAAHLAATALQDRTTSSLTVMAASLLVRTARGNPLTRIRPMTLCRSGVSYAEDTGRCRKQATCCSHPSVTSAAERLSCIDGDARGASTSGLFV